MQAVHRMRRGPRWGGGGGGWGAPPGWGMARGPTVIVTQQPMRTSFLCRGFCVLFAVVPAAHSDAQTSPTHPTVPSLSPASCDLRDRWPCRCILHAGNASVQWARAGGWQAGASANLRPWPSPGANLRTRPRAGAYLQHRPCHLLVRAHRKRWRCNLCARHSGGGNRDVWSHTCTSRRSCRRCLRLPAHRYANCLLRAIRTHDGHWLRPYRHCHACAYCKCRQLTGCGRSGRRRRRCRCKPQRLGFSGGFCCCRRRLQHGWARHRAATPSLRLCALVRACHHHGHASCHCCLWLLGSC